MKIKAYYKGSTLWSVHYCPQEMKKMYFLSWYNFGVDIVIF
jgi:hypothetical protein